MFEGGSIELLFDDHQQDLPWILLNGRDRLHTRATTRGGDIRLPRGKESRQGGSGTREFSNAWHREMDQYDTDSMPMFYFVSPCAQIERHLADDR